MSIDFNPLGTTIFIMELKPHSNSMVDRNAIIDSFSFLKIKNTRKAGKL